MRFKIFFFLAFFATSAVTAQLYDNRNRYLQSPYNYNRFGQELDAPPKKPTNQYAPRVTSSRNSYNNYQNRVNQYSRAYLTTDEFYKRFRDPEIHRRYASSKNSLGGSETNEEDCHCNISSDLLIYKLWYDDALREMGRRALLNFYEGLFEKKLEKLLNKSFPNFKEAQKAFYKKYGKIKDNEYRQQISNMISNDLYQSQLEFGKAKSYYKFFDYVKTQNDINIRQTSSRTKDMVGDMVVSGMPIRGRGGRDRKIYNITSDLNSLSNNMKNSYKELVISRKISAELGRNRSLFYDYLSEKYVEHYNNENNYEYRLGAFNGYIEHYQNRVGYHVKLPTHSYGKYMLFKVPFNENELRAFFKKRLEKNVDYTYRGSLPTIETAIANVALFELDEFNSRELSLIHFNRLKDKEHKKRLYGEIKQAVLNKKTLKNAVIQYFKNAIPIDHNAIQSVKDAVGSRLENKPFLWNELDKMPYFKFQNVTNPNVLFTLDLKVKVINNSRRTSGGRRLPSSIIEYNKYKGIADVLKYIYNVEKYWHVEGATIRHFLKQKGLNVPSSLSNYDLGKLFDFGGGNSNTLTIQFSDYAKKYITNFQHGDGKYGTSLFTDPFKLRALEEILKGSELDFQNEIIRDKSFIGTKMDCVLNDLLSRKNNLLLKTIEAFTKGNSKFRIKFTAIHNPYDTGIARTSLPDKNGIIEIKFNTSRTKGVNSIELAGAIIHEVIHAELHRLKLRNNSVPNPLPNDLFSIYINFWKFYEGVYSDTRKVATVAEHYFMSDNYIKPIANALREFDNFKHPVKNYEYFAWTGLHHYGTEAGYITKEELKKLADLSEVIHTDGNKNSCDE